MAKYFINLFQCLKRRFKIRLWFIKAEGVLAERNTKSKKKPHSHPWVLRSVFSPGTAGGAQPSASLISFGFWSTAAHRRTAAPPPLANVTTQEYMIFLCRGFKPYPSIQCHLYSEDIKSIFKVTTETVTI